MRYCLAVVSPSVCCHAIACRQDRPWQHRTLTLSLPPHVSHLPRANKQVEEKKDEVEALQQKLEGSKTAHKREGALMMSSFYGMGLELNARLLAEAASSPRSTSSSRGMDLSSSPTSVGGNSSGGGEGGGSSGATDSPVGLLNQQRASRKPRRRGAK